MGRIAVWGQKAELVGRRLVAASKVTRAGHLNEELTKALTGEDTINARHPYGRPFQYVPIAKFFLRVNEKPIIRGQSHGMWRRVKLVPFMERFAIDNRLRAVLRDEAQGILALLVRGCCEWQRDGLRHPAIVEAATTAYRTESNPLGAFLAARCVVRDDMRMGVRETFAAYRAWCEDEQLPAEERLSQTAFGSTMKERFGDAGTERKVMYAGVGCVPRQTRSRSVRPPLPARRLRDGWPPETRKPRIRRGCTTWHHLPGSRLRPHA